MAKLIVKGKIATIELTRSDTDDQSVWATCVKHDGVKRPKAAWDWGYRGPGCNWIKEYDNLDDAAEYATNHADNGGQG